MRVLFFGAIPVAAMLATGLSTLAQDSADHLTGDEIKTVLMSYKTTGTSSSGAWEEEYQVGDGNTGRITGVSGGQTYKGEWEINDNVLCRTYKYNYYNSCATVQREGTKITFYKADDGSVLFEATLVPN